MLKGVIFDLDGTLADTLPVCFAAFRHAFREMTGRVYTDEEITALFGPTEEGSILQVAPERAEECMQLFLEEYERAHSECPEPFPGISEALQLLEERGVKTAVVTGKGAHSAAISLRILALEPCFTLVESGSVHGPIKPLAIGKVLAQWNLPAQEVAYVGDTPSDVVSARKAGVHPISAAWADTADYSALQAMSPEAIFRTVPDFIAWLHDRL